MGVDRNDGYCRSADLASCLISREASSSAFCSSILVLPDGQVLLLSASNKAVKRARYSHRLKPRPPRGFFFGTLLQAESWPQWRQRLLHNVTFARQPGFAMMLSSLRVSVGKDKIIVTLPEECFRAVYYRRHGKKNLRLGRRSQTDDFELLSSAWRVATDKARELGWIA